MAESEEALTHVEPEEDVKMTIWEHLGELRSRLTKAAAGLIAGAVACWTFREKLLAWLTVPYTNAWNEAFKEAAAKGERPELQTLAPADAFVNYMQLALVGGVILAAPIIFYQLWAFISPGLYQKEKRYIVPFVLFSSTLFGSGVAFAYYVALPFSFPFFFSLLGQVGGVTLQTRPTMEYYLDFVEHMLLAFGFVFELPLFIGFMALAGIVTPMQLVRFSRYAIVASFVVGAFVTPGPEISSQIAVSSALIGLYFLSVGLSFLVAKKKDVPSEEAPEKKKKKKKKKKETPAEE
jgi:sec-independent protein translocase protein TatC